MDKWGVCLKSGCPTLTATSWCPIHQPAAWATSNRRSRLPKNWSSLRRMVLKRDRHRCVHCGDPATEVDHIVPGDDHRLANLQSLCADCHRIKTHTDRRHHHAG